MGIQDAVLVAGKKEVEKNESESKEKDKKKSEYARVGNRLITGLANSVNPIKNISKKDKYGNITIRQVSANLKMPSSSQVLRFVSPEQKPQDLDEMEQLRRQINIPRRPEPTIPLVFGSDLAIANSFELHQDTKRNRSDLSHGEDVMQEDIYGGLDFI